MERFKRTVQLFEKANFEKISQSNILVVGVGGVGGYVCEVLARSGVGQITIIDFDVVDITNINRQIIALDSTIGKYKVDVLKDRMLQINPLIKVNAVKEKITKQNLMIYLNQNYTYVIDAIDSIDDKIELIKACKDLNLNIVSAMGTANRIDVPQYVVSDIYKTHNDGLAKKVRKLLRECGVKSLDVVYSPNVQNSSNILGSVAYHPSVCGITIAGYVINQIIKKGENYGSNNN